MTRPRLKFSLGEFIQPGADSARDPVLALHVEKSWIEVDATTQDYTLLHLRRKPRLDYEECSEYSRYGNHLFKS